MDTSFPNICSGSLYILHCSLVISRLDESRTFCLLLLSTVGHRARSTVSLFCYCVCSPFRCDSLAIDRFQSFTALSRIYFLACHFQHSICINSYLIWMVGDYRNWMVMKGHFILITFPASNDGQVKSRHVRSYSPLPPPPDVVDHNERSKLWTLRARRPLCLWTHGSAFELLLLLCKSNEIFFLLRPSFTYFFFFLRLDFIGRRRRPPDGR